MTRAVTDEAALEVMVAFLNELCYRHLPHDEFERGLEYMLWRYDGGLVEAITYIVVKAPGGSDE